MYTYSLIDKGCSIVYQSKIAGNNNNSIHQSNVLNESKAKYSDIAKRLSSSSSSSSNFHHHHNYSAFLANSRCKPTSSSAAIIVPSHCTSSSISSSSLSCPFHGTQAHLCSSEARVLSRANKILMYVCLMSSSIQNRYRFYLSSFISFSFNNPC